MPDVKVFEIPDVAETLDDVAGDVRIVPVKLPDLPQDLLGVALVEVGVEQLPDVLVQGRPLLSRLLGAVRGRNTVVGILYHGAVSAVQRHHGFLTEHLFQVYLGPPVTVWGPE